MDISGVMNIHDLAMTKTIRQQTDVQGRQEKMNQRIEPQDANQTPLMGNKTPLEAYPGALTNTVEQQEDPQAAKIRVERQVDVQAAKETVQGAEEKVHPKAGSKETGNLIDIIT
jgi:hypothetical protein